MKRADELLLVLSLCALAGCRSPAPCGNSNFYPLGIYGVNSTNDFAAVKGAGFNLITGPANRAFLDAARAHGLKVLASPNTSAGPAFDPAQARQAIHQFDSHPALWAWYLVDEPDFNQISPEHVKRAQRFVKSLRSAKPTALVLFQGYQARYYANIADITMIDRYPIPWLPLANFGQHVQMTRLALPKSKPLIAVIQAFDWSCCPELLPGETNLRPPTYEELHCMTYDALARGANGLFYYAYTDSRWRIREHPETWAALQRVIAEASARLPLFQAKPLWWPKEHVFGDPAHRFNAALESSISSCRLRVSQGNAMIPEGDYILAVNNTERHHTYSFTVPEGERAKGEAGRQKSVTLIPSGNRKESNRRRLGAEEKKLEERRGEAEEGREEKFDLSPKFSDAGGAPSRIEFRASHFGPREDAVPVVGEDRKVAVQKRWVTDEFGPYAVHVYGPLWAR